MRPLWNDNIVYSKFDDAGKIVLTGVNFPLDYIPTLESSLHGLKEFLTKYPQLLTTSSSTVSVRNRILDFSRNHNLYMSNPYGNLENSGNMQARSIRGLYNIIDRSIQGLTFLALLNTCDLKELSKAKECVNIFTEYF